MQKLLGLLILGIGLSPRISAQKNEDKYLNIISEEALKSHLSILASDSLEGRETSKKGQYMAAKYIADHFEKIGLNPLINNSNHPSYFQWFKLYHSVFGILNRRLDKYQLNTPSEEDKDKFEEAFSMNVMGFIPGTTYPDEYIVISSHYDHLGMTADSAVFNGADDDGSGTAAVLTLAESFMNAVKDGNGPKRSILFVCFAGEEKGLLGSKYFTDVKPPIPLNQIMCNLNIDMIGRKDKHHEHSNYVYLIGADKLSNDLDSVSKAINQNKYQLEIDYTYNDEKDPNRFYYRSDHYNFAKNGIPVIFYFTGVHEDYHKTTDDIDKILFPKYSKIARYIFSTAWELSTRNEKLRLN